MAYDRSPASGASSPGSVIDANEPSARGPGRPARTAAARGARDEDGRRRGVAIAPLARMARRRLQPVHGDERREGSPHRPRSARVDRRLRAGAPLSWDRGPRQRARRARRPRGGTPDRVALHRRRTSRRVGGSERRHHPDRTRNAARVGLGGRLLNRLSTRSVVVVLVRILLTELYVVPSCEEHMRQHADRLTGVDERFKETADALSHPPPETTHVIADKLHPT